jgi:hypothetical protein
MARIRPSIPPAPTIAVLVAGLLLGGCAAGMHVQATVAGARASCGGPAARGGEGAQPLAGAAVSMSCPQVIKADGLSRLGTTDARGVLDFEEHPLGRWIHDGCDLVVEMPGYQPKRLPVADVCVEYSTNHCVHAVVTAVLVRSEAAAAPCR